MLIFEPLITYFGVPLYCRDFLFFFLMCVCGGVGLKVAKADLELKTFLPRRSFSKLYWVYKRKPVHSMFPGGIIITTVSAPPLPENHLRRKAVTAVSV